MKIVSYNINGIRAAMKRGLVDWLAASDFDVVCFQELKAQPDQFDVTEFEDLGYHAHWHSAEKKGYSGVAILTKEKPDRVDYGMGVKIYDVEGRIIRADLGDLTVVSAYFPSGSSGEHRQEIKMKFLRAYSSYQRKLRAERPNSIVCGDYNIAHTEIDIHNPVSNKKSSGFLPEERDWMTKLLKKGWIDTFRHVHPERLDAYSWWSFRSNARASNKGWRIDYCAATKELKDRILDADIHPDAEHSDHCPISVQIKC